MAGGGLMQLVAYGAQSPTELFCDVGFITRNRVYNTFQVITFYDDEFSDTTLIPNFYDNIYDTFFLDK